MNTHILYSNSVHSISKPVNCWLIFLLQDAIRTLLH